MIKDSREWFVNIKEIYSSGQMDSSPIEYTTVSIQTQYISRLDYNHTTVDEYYKKYIDSEIVTWKMYLYYCFNAEELHEQKR